MVEGDNINFGNNVMAEKCNLTENNVLLVFAEFWIYFLMCS